jgi:prevent-host-death family protein
MSVSGLKISATEAARKFSDLVNRVYYKAEVFVVERGGEPVGQISPVGAAKFTGADFVELLSSLPRPDAGYLDLLKELNRSQQPVEGDPHHE